MSILVRFAPTSMTTDQYEQVRSAVEAGGDFPPEGMEYHVCFGPEGNRKVSEIWSSPEQFQAFGERLMPLVAEAGIEMAEPEVLEIHAIIQPERTPGKG